MSQRNEFHKWFSTSVPFQITKLWETHKYPAHPPSLDFSFHSTTYFLLSKSTQKNSNIALFLLYMLHSTSQRSGKHISTLSIPRLWPFRFYQPLLPAIQEHLKNFSIVTLQRLIGPYILSPRRQFIYIFMSGHLPYRPHVSACSCFNRYNGNELQRYNDSYTEDCHIR